MIEQIQTWDWPDGYKKEYYEDEATPNLSPENIRLIVKKQNEIIDKLNELEQICKKLK